MPITLQYPNILHFIFAARSLLFAYNFLVITIVSIEVCHVFRKLKFSPELAIAYVREIKWNVSSELKGNLMADATLCEWSAKLYVLISLAGSTKR